MRRQCARRSGSARVIDTLRRFAEVFRLCGRDVHEGLRVAIVNREEARLHLNRDPVTGKEIWKHAYDHPLDPKYYEGGPSATPTVDGDRLYMLFADPKNEQDELTPEQAKVLGRLVKEEFG